VLTLTTLTLSAASCGATLYTHLPIQPPVDALSSFFSRRANHTASARLSTMSAEMTYTAVT
jgi:hypothetical protein